MALIFLIGLPWLLCLDKIRDRESDFFTSDHEAGWYEEHQAASLLGTMLGKFASRISDHMSLVDGRKG